jgi:N-acetyl-anhydromuramyl-L-alanine amidase AmpD
VSSHVGVDDTPGRIGEYVRRDFAAWTQASANPCSVAVELCAYAAWSSVEWDRHPVMLENVAAWIAEEAQRFGIPIRRLTAAQAQGTYAGVCGHNELGAMGGGHWDPGPAFPWQRVLDMASGNVPPPKEVNHLAALVHHQDSNGVSTYAGISKDGELLEYKADGARDGTPAHSEHKTWSAYNLTANAAGANEKRFAT